MPFISRLNALARMGLFVFFALPLALAEAGAIYRVWFRNGTFGFAVIAESEPRGLCGSGLVDLIAGLVTSGGLTSMGQFLPPVPQGGFALARGERDIVLTKRDVDVFQRAKAAIGRADQG